MFFLSRSLFGIAVLGLLLPFPGTAADWSRVEKVLSVKGAQQPGQVYKFSLPRTDLTVTVDGIALKPALALGSWLAFQETEGTTLLMGDLVLAPAEVVPVMRQLAKGGIKVTALHNHLLRAAPTPWYLHITGQGDPLQLAQTLRTALARSATPLEAIPDTTSTAESLALDTAQLDEILRHPGKADDGIYKFALPRDEIIQIGGVPVAPAMGLATVLSFQPIGAGQAVVYGDFMLRAEEVNPVLHTLQTHGIEVMALHNHLLEEKPRLFFMHFWAHGKAEKLARGLRAALAQMKSSTL